MGITYELLMNDYQRLMLEWKRWYKNGTNGLRMGQALMNAEWQINKDRSSVPDSVDCFYDDSKILAFLYYVLGNKLYAYKGK